MKNQSAATATAESIERAVCEAFAKVMRDTDLSAAFELRLSEGAK